MIFDRTTQYSNGQAFTATAVSTNVIDHLAAGIPYGSSAALTRDLGTGPEVPILVQVTTTFTGLTSLAVTYQTSDVENFGSGVDNVVTTAAVPAADLKAGYQFAIDQIPYKARKRYSRLNYTVVGTGTGGAITAGAVAAVQKNPL
ncbi:Bbp16 family capsid cement protein [Brevundimonas faecalis]|uniref:Bbp16 family capsid cement protein n=1 Tax=Brevundimonas faecalis TaxID=947378 RepID=UPI00362372D4